MVYRREKAVRGYFSPRKAGATAPPGAPIRQGPRKKGLDRAGTYCQNVSMRRKQLDYDTAMVLKAVGNGYEYAFELEHMLGLPLRTVYRKLDKLEGANLIKSGSEPHEIVVREKRRPRTRYEITRDGSEALKETVRRHPLLSKLLPHVPRKPRVAPTGGYSALGD